MRRGGRQLPACAWPRGHEALRHFCTARPRPAFRLIRAPPRFPPSSPRPFRARISLLPSSSGPLPLRPLPFQIPIRTTDRIVGLGDTGGNRRGQPFRPARLSSLAPLIDFTPFPFPPASVLRVAENGLKGQLEMAPEGSASPSPVDVATCGKLAASSRPGPNDFLLGVGISMYQNSGCGGVETNWSVFGQQRGVPPPWSRNPPPSVLLRPRARSASPSSMSTSYSVSVRLPPNSDSESDLVPDPSLRCPLLTHKKGERKLRKPLGLPTPLHQCSPTSSHQQLVCPFSPLSLHPLPIPVPQACNPIAQGVPLPLLLLCCLLPTASQDAPRLGVSSAQSRSAFAS